MSPWSLSMRMAGPTRSNASEKPRKKGTESFSMRNILVCASAGSVRTSNSRLTASLFKVDIEVFLLVVIVYVGIVYNDGVNDMVGRADGCNLVEIGR